MTYEELKEEAKKQGYTLIKKRPYIKLDPCVCGGERRSLWHSPEGYELRCNKCGLQGGLGINERQAREFWNKKVNTLKLIKAKELWIEAIRG